MLFANTVTLQIPSYVLNPPFFIAAYVLLVYMIVGVIVRFNKPKINSGDGPPFAILFLFSPALLILAIPIFAVVMTIALVVWLFTGVWVLNK